jgi:3-mercaptopyruvate sulfurtransferase SseA
VKIRFRTIGLASIALLLVSCSALNTKPVEDVPVAPALANEEQSAAVASPEVTTADDVLRIGAEEANALVEAGQAVLVDVRSAQSYASLHAAGAVSLPESKAPGRVDQLPTDQALVFY